MQSTHAQLATSRGLSAACRPGFSLTEMLVTMSIIVLLLGALFAALGPTIRYVRAESERQTLRTLAQSLENYKQINGFLPPLVNDGPDTQRTPGTNGPIIGTTAATAQPNIKGSALIPPPGGVGGVSGFLRYEASPDTAGSDNTVLANGNYVSRSSIYSLPVYLAGSLERNVDGVDQFGSNNADAEGRFLKGTGNNKPMLDTAKFAERLQPRLRDGTEVTDRNRVVILDRWGTPIRYYRWLPTFHQASGPGSPLVYTFSNGSAPPANATNQAREVRSTNTPWPIGDPRDTTNALLRGASAAVVSAGPDKQINDGVPWNEGVNRDNIVELVP